MIRWFDTRKAFEAVAGPLHRERAVIEPVLARKRRFEGYCTVCNEVKNFRVRSGRRTEWLNLRESFICPGCGLNGRGRLAHRLLTAEIEAEKRRIDEPRVLMLERVTPFYDRIAETYPYVIGSEYLGDDKTPGTVHEFVGRQVRHESMLGLSFEDESLDIVFHGDVLEHVPDYRLGLRECARVLVEGGRMVFTVPMFEVDEHLVRAELIDGEIVHHMEKAYHGNPVSTEGSLVYVHHGWPLLDDVLEAGFSRVQIGLLYSPFEGMLSTNGAIPDNFMWPIVFRAVR